MTVTIKLNGIIIAKEFLSLRNIKRYEQAGFTIVESEVG